MTGANHGSPCASAVSTLRAGWRGIAGPTYGREHAGPLPRRRGPPFRGRSP
jgi:hypothetical protein